jgi:hypothetical protein
LLRISGELAMTGKIYSLIAMTENKYRLIAMKKGDGV